MRSIRYSLFIGSMYFEILNVRKSVFVCVKTNKQKQTSVQIFINLKYFPRDLTKC